MSETINKALMKSLKINIFFCLRVKLPFALVDWLKNILFQQRNRVGTEARHAEKRVFEMYMQKKHTRKKEKEEKEKIWQQL